MIRLFSIALSALLLFQSVNIDVADLVQIDEFIEHAQFHSERYGDNVFVFISKHYGELKADHTKEHQEEEEEHNQLPFQQHSAFSTIAIILPTTKAELQAPEFADYKSHNFYYQAPISSLHSLGLFQPPRHS